MVRNLITLYPSNETSFTSNGLGSLADSESCIVKEEYNGAFELEMTYPITGAHYKDIEPRCIIYTKPNPIDPPQAFRIYQITKPMNGMISIYANHISYDLDGYPLEPFSSENCAGALQGFVTHSIIKHPFTFWTDKETLANFAVKTPMSIRSALGGTEGSILDVYGGVYKFDNFTVRLFQHRGSDRGVTIRYGKNLTDLNQEEEIANCYTEVMPYWYDQENDILLKLSENTVPVENHEFNFRRVLVLDVSSDFEEQPSEAQMRERAKQYIQDNQIWVPKVSLTVSYAQLSQSEEYKQYNMYERVEIDDTVNIEFQKLGITAHAKVIETDYNVKYGRYDSVTLGNAQSSMSSTFADQAEEFKQRVEQTKSDLQRSVDRATKWITNGRGYMVAVKDPEGNWMEICSLDTPNLDEAMNVWRWNNAGFGFSANGYNGEYRTAITQDGHIVADFIDTGTLTATLVKTGILQSKDGETFYLDLDRGILRMKATGLSIEGKTVEEIAQEKADAAQAYADQQIANYSNLVTNQFANVQSQLDGQIESYFRQYEPKMTNEPASEWDTDEKRQAHEGDIFYWEKEDGTSYAYRFMKDSTLGSWGWNLIQDTDITKAIADAAHAQDTADGKRRNFVITPYPPYDIGDQWTDSDTGEVYTCVTAKAKGGIYNREDWSKLNIYTDDTIANQALDEARKSKYLVMSLDNDYEGILTDPSGHYEGTLNAQTKVQVFWGTKDVSGDCEYVIIPSSGVKANWNLATRTVTVTELTTDKGYVDITAKYNDDTFEVTKRFNVAKVKRGLDGATGKDGEDGADGTSYKIKVTSMHLSQTQLDQIASPDESHWPETFTLDTGVSENTTADLKVGDYVSLSVYNEDKDSIAYVQGKVVGISSVSVLTCNTYGYIDRGDAGKKTVQLKCGKLSHTLAEWESYGTDGEESTWAISGYDNSSIAVGDNVYLVGGASDALDSIGNPINVMLYMTAKSISASSFVGIATALVMGYEGKQGEKGEQGEPGKQGAKGEQGTQGINLILNSTNSGHGYVWTPRNNGNSSDLYNFISFPIPELVKANTTYTASLYGIKITSGTFDSLSFILSIDGNTTVIRTDTSISGDRAVAKLTPSKDASYLLVYAGPAGSTRNNGMTAEKIKFEEGNVPNPIWTPAPQDLIGPQGPAGAKGDKGDTGPSFQLKLSSNFVTVNQRKKTVDKTSITASAYSIVGNTRTPHSVYWSLVYTMSGTQYIDSPSIASATYTISNIKSTWTAAKLTAYFDPARKQIFDTEDVEFLRDPLSLTAQETFDMLTDSGKRQGLFQDEDGNYYISFTYAKGGTLVLGSTNNARGELQVLDTDGKTVVGRWNNSGITIAKGSIRSANYKLDDQGWPSTGIAIEVDNGNFHTRGISAFDSGNVYILKSLTTQSGGRIAGFIFTTNRFYKMMEASTSNYGVGMSTSPNYYGLWLGETNTAGGNGLTDAPFKVLLSGGLYATKANITGAITGSTITGSTFYTKGNPSFVSIYNNSVKFGYKYGGEDEIEEVDPDDPIGYRTNTAWIHSLYSKSADNGGDIGTLMISTDTCFGVYSFNGKLDLLVAKDVTHGTISEDHTWVKCLRVGSSVTAYNIYANGTVHASNFETDGGDIIIPASTKSYGSISAYSYATATPYYGDIGDGELDGEGLCYIYIDDVFSEMINTNQYMVFLQKEGSGDLWIKEKTKTYFVVEGTPLLHFAWELKAKKKSNEYLRLENVLNLNETEQSKITSDIVTSYDYEKITSKEERVYNKELLSEFDEIPKKMETIETNYDIEVNNLIKEREELL